jgi:hypothetical protein
MILPDIYAGKMHAVLFRSRGNRVKGREIGTILNGMLKKKRFLISNI